MYCFHILPSRRYNSVFRNVQLNCYLPCSVFADVVVAVAVVASLA